MKRRLTLARELAIVAACVVIAVAAARLLPWRPFSYRSAAEIGSLPLVHVVIDFDRRAVSEAAAIVAVADRATGVVAIGAISTGVVALGAIAIGPLAAGAIAIGPDRKTHV